MSVPYLSLKLDNPFLTAGQQASPDPSLPYALPLDILTYVAAHFLDPTTLSTFIRCNRQLYDLTARSLYSNIHLHNERQSNLLMRMLIPTWDSMWADNPRVQRNFSYIRQLHLHWNKPPDPKIPTLRLQQHQLKNLEKVVVYSGVGHNFPDSWINIFVSSRTLVLRGHSRLRSTPQATSAPEDLRDHPTWWLNPEELAVLTHSSRLETITIRGFLQIDTPRFPPDSISTPINIKFKHYLRFTSGDEEFLIRALALAAMAREYVFVLCDEEGRKAVEEIVDRDVVKASERERMQIVIAGKQEWQDFE